MIHFSTVLQKSNALCAHGFFEMSDNNGQSQNVAFTSDEDPEIVSARRSRMIEHLSMPAGPVMSMKQIHSNKVIHVSEPWERGHAPQADGFVTSTPGIILGILTADCCPVLFADPNQRVVGACHAGWKGAVAGIVENTIHAMIELGAEPQHIVTAIGPTIQQISYEVGPELPLKALFPPYFYSQCFKPSGQPGHHLFDLPGYIKLRLANLKVKAIDDLSLNTYSDNFFSRRRCVAKKYVYDKKSNLSCIALR